MTGHSSEDLEGEGRRGRGTDARAMGRRVMLLGAALTGVCSSVVAASGLAEWWRWDVRRSPVPDCDRSPARGTAAPFPAAQGIHVISSLTGPFPLQLRCKSLFARKRPSSPVLEVLLLLPTDRIPSVQGLA